MNTEPNSAVLSDWIQTATHGLCDSEKARVRMEISAHVSEQINALVANGCSTDSALAQALKELGSPKKARARYRRVYLTRHDEQRLNEFRKPYTLITLWISLTSFALVFVSFNLMFEPGEMLAVQISLNLVVSDLAGFAILRYTFSKQLSLLLWSQAAFLLAIGVIFLLWALFVDFETIAIRALMLMLSACTFVRFTAFAFEAKRLLAKIENADGGAGT
ncbi:MAG: permease prefix domain 1-containing protein [Candidatus Hydrogenedentes bacterium]|nr:permease prefix domain 1-containing protein [Candidatus Hydrogenedentota bacterium]